MPKAARMSAGPECAALLVCESQAQWKHQPGLGEGAGSLGPQPLPHFLSEGSPHGAPGHKPQRSHRTSECQHTWSTPEVT